MKARCEADDEEYAYRAYVTESLRMQHQNKSFTISWMDIVDKTPPKPEKSGDEIALEVILGAGLRLEG